jgi:hypothetical protein
MSIQDALSRLVGDLPAEWVDQVFADNFLNTRGRQGGRGVEWGDASAQRRFVTNIELLCSVRCGV